MVAIAFCQWDMRPALAHHNVVSCIVEVEQMKYGSVAMYIVFLLRVETQELGENDLAR